MLNATVEMMCETGEKEDGTSLTQTYAEVIARGETPNSVSYAGMGHLNTVAEKLGWHPNVLVYNLIKNGPQCVAQRYLEVLEQ